MQLHVDSDATYLVLSKARSRGAGHFYLIIHTPPGISIPQPPTNGPILTEYVTLRNVMISAAEAETSTLYHNGIAVIPICVTLNELHHPQGPTSFKTDNDTVKIFLTSTIRKKRSKVWDCKCHWMKEKKMTFLEFIGIKRTRIRVITSQSTTLKPFTNVCNQYMSLTLKNNFAL